MSTAARSKVKVKNCYCKYSLKSNLSEMDYKLLCTGGVSCERVTLKGFLTRSIPVESTVELTKLKEPKNKNRVQDSTASMTWNCLFHHFH